MTQRRPSRADSEGFVYLLHYSGRTSAGRRHYLGWSADVNRRFAEHRSGRGAGETRRARAEGLAMTLAQFWRGSPELETEMKLWSRRGRKGFAGLCPLCPASAELPAELAVALGPPSLVRRFIGVDDLAAPLAGTVTRSPSTSLLGGL